MQTDALRLSFIYIPHVFLKFKNSKEEGGVQSPLPLVYEKGESTKI